MSLSIGMVLAACLAACYLSACHVALKRYSRTRLSELLEERGQQERLRRLNNNRQEYLLITGVLRTALNLLVLVAVMLELERQQTGLWIGWNLAIGFVVASALVSVFAVAIPVAWANYHAEWLIARSLPLLRTMHAVFWLLVAALHVFDPIVRRITGVDMAAREEELSDEVLTVVEDRDIAGDIDEAQKHMLEAVFDLPNTDVAEIMTPRTDVKGIEVTCTLDEVKRLAMQFGHSRIPVFEEDLDHVVGMLYVKDLIEYLGDGKDFNLRNVLREPFLVPESKKVHELLAEFKARKVHLALVLDEYGGTAGLVTIEDVLEEIVGEIQDEYELTQVEPAVERVDANQAECDARVRIDTLNDELDLELPEDEGYDTVGGFVSSMLGHIPEVGESFEFAGCRFTITAAERTRVARVRVEKLETESAPTE